MTRAVWIVPWLAMLLSGPAGPKSGHVDRCNRPDSWRLNMRGEGSGEPMLTSEEGGFHRPFWPTSKPHGKGQEEPHGAQSQPYTAAKRSFRRALQRANQFGWAVHKGHVITATKHVTPVAPSQPAYNPMPRGRRGKRATVLSWNTGGLTTELYQQFVHWATSMQIDILLLQATRWKDDRTWSSHGYHFVQSGDPLSVSSSHAGLIVGISDRLCKMDDIAYASVLPGRIQRVHCRLDSKALDIINVYQYPDTPTQTRADPMKSRAHLWQQLDKTLHQIAHRNILVLGGDFNTPLAGHGNSPSKPPMDTLELRSLVKKYHLGSVRTHDGGPTFIGTQGASTIDFVFLRQIQFDHPARQGKCLRDTPLACWRETPDHFPILSSISLGWTCWHAKKPLASRLSRLTQEHMYQEWRQQTSRWQTFEHALNQDLPANMSSLQVFMQTTVQQCSQHFRLVKPPPPKENPHRPLVADLWSHFRALRQPQQPDLCNIFHAWSHITKIRDLKKQLTASCKAAKQMRLLEAVRQAEEAAAHHDTRKLFCIIRSIAPKAPYKLIRLRGQNGAALTAPEECALLEAHFREVFQCQMQQTSLEGKPLACMPFSKEALANAFAQASIHKAVAPGTLPNIVIRSLANELADWIWPHLDQLWTCQSPIIPQSWKDAWLCLIAKKNVRQPKDVRPIALTDGIGKTVLGLLTQELKHMIQPSLTPLPIFAFMPHRGTEEALMFVFQHCRKVRNACTLQQGNYWSRLQGHTLPDLAGGAILSLDMSQAFDRLPRDWLQHGFDITQVPPEISQMFMLWLQDAEYHLDHRGVKAAVLSNRGVRQGCKASPTEWTLFLVAVLKKLDATMPGHNLTSWIRNHMITYADDLIALWSLTCKSDVSHMLKQIGHLLDVLHEAGMIVNLTKTAFLLRLNGKQSKLIRKSLIVTKDHKQWLRVPRTNQQETLIPLVKAHVYLGAKISFFSFEDLTLSHRLHIGRATFLRLRPWLLQRHTYPLALRVKLWETCVRTSCLHSLQAVGITSRGAQRLHQRFLADLRQIARSPSHITHESSVDLCVRLGLQLPLTGLAELWKTQYEQRCIKWEGLESSNFLKQFDHHAHHSRIMQVFDQSKPNVTLSEIELCPYCDFSTMNQSQLTKHLISVHQISKITNAFVPLRDMFQGRPHCTHCGKLFTGFAGLRTHIIKNSCPHFDGNRPWQVPLADHDQLRTMAANGNWLELWADESLLGQLRQCCVICNHHAPSPKSLAEHLHRDHPSAWEAAQVHLAPLIALNVGHPCRACGQRGSRSHACPVLRQLALIKALQAKGASASTLLTPDTRPTTDLPLSSPVKKCKVKDDRQQKKPVVHEFHPARDSLDGLPQCAHCGRPSHNHFALSKHIEEGHCPEFDAARCIGSHVPCAWEWLCNLAKPEVPRALLFHPEALQVIKTTCVLCGQKLGHARHVQAHLQHDHNPMLEKALTSHPTLIADLKAINPCCCDCIRPQLDHHCSVHTQILLLHHLCDTQKQPCTSTAEDDPKPYLEAWQDEALRAKLTHQCSLCDVACGNQTLMAHLDTHEGLVDSLLPYVHLAQSPFMDCCPACMAEEALPETCPVALNLCGYVRHRQLGPSRGGLHGSDRGLSGTSHHCFAGEQEKKGNGHPPKTSATKTGSSASKGNRAISATSRKPVASPSYGRPIHTFFTSRSSGNPSSLGPGNLPLERDDREEGHKHTTSPTPLSDADPRTADKTGAAIQSQAHRSSLAESIGSAHDYDRGPVAVPSIRPAAKEDDSYGQKAHSNDPDDPVGPRDARTLPRSASDPSVQVLKKAGTEPGQASDALVDPTLHETSSSLGHHDDPWPLQRLEPHSQQTRSNPLAESLAKSMHGGSQGQKQQEHA